MDSRQKQKILTDVLRLTKKEYAQKKEAVEKVQEQEKLNSTLDRLNKQ